MRELVIGGLRFALDPARPEGLQLIESDTTYTSFVARDHSAAPASAVPASAAFASAASASAASASADLEVTVALTLEPAPDVTDLPVLFDTEETWTAFDDGESTILRLRTVGGPSAYLWQAVLASEDEPIRVHCGPLLIRRSYRTVKLRNPLHYPLDQLLLMFLLAPQQGVIVHAAGLARDGRGVFLAGRSGAGKTTFMRQCEGREDLEGLSDDRVVVREMAGSFRVFGTPWAGEGRVAANRRADLAAICFLHQSSHNELRPIGAAAALQQLVATVSILWFDPSRMEAAMSLCERLVSEVPCYELHCRAEPQAVELLDELI